MRMRMLWRSKNCDHRRCFSNVGGDFGSWLGALVVVLVTTASGSTGLAQQSAVAENSHAAAAIAQHLDAGEFPQAIAQARTLAPALRDRLLGQISQRQMEVGAVDAAYQTVGELSSDLSRASLLNGWADGGGAPSAQGGITAADYTPLVNLITGTIAPDTWQDTGQGLGTLQPYPSGVFIDSEGVLKRIPRDKLLRVERMRNRFRQDSGNRDAHGSSDLRKVSLTRLEEAAQLDAARGLPLDETMANLAGIYEVRYLIVYPETGDIVLAGPAGPWQLDIDGRAINVETQKPVLRLDDLVVCLRNAWGSDGKFGCSINPRQANLAATKNYLETTKLKGRRWSAGIQAALGQQDIEVFGINPASHAARVLVEADYRMKLMGMGLEASVPGVKSYLDRIELNADGALPEMDVVRWWFTLSYDNVTSDEEQSTFAFSGSGVKVLSENEFINSLGERKHTGESNRFTKGFADDFTKHFDEIAAAYPIYRELKNVFDLALVSRLIVQQKLDGKTAWHGTYFGQPKHGTEPGLLRFRVTNPNASPAVEVDSVLNERILRQRKANSTLKHRIVGVSGGIVFDATKVVAADFVPTKDAALGEQRDLAKPDVDEAQWWWD